MPYKTTATQFFVFAFLWSLTFWGLTVVTGGINQFPGSLLFYVGGAGPFIAALALIHLREPRVLQKDFWISTFSPGRMSSLWLVIAIIIHPVLVSLAALLEFLMGGSNIIRWEQLASPAAFLTLSLSVFIFGPLPEEMGWRGIAQDRLQTRMSGVRASLILGFAWALWHVPLFFIEGTFQHGLGAGSLRFWIFLGTIIPLTFIITWVYNHTNRSILSAVLVHFTGNMGGALLAKTDRLALLELLMLSLFAIWLVWKDGPDLGTIKQAEAGS